MLVLNRPSVPTALSPEPSSTSPRHLLAGLAQTVASVSQLAGATHNLYFLTLPSQRVLSVGVKRPKYTSSRLSRRLNALAAIAGATKEVGLSSTCLKILWKTTVRSLAVAASWYSPPPAAASSFNHLTPA